jgi:carboxyl-terminal processing protease
MQDDTRSRYDGLGLVVSTRDGQLTVVTSMDGGPAAKAGLLTGDLIVKINGQATEKMQVSDAVSMLKGKPNDKITLTILRPTNREVKDYTLTRTEIKVESVKDVRMLSSEPNGGGYKIGFIRITQFNEPTAEDLAKKLEELQKAGMNALVLDLRNNPGGLLNSAVDVCAQFVAPGTMVCYTDGRAPSANRIYRTPTNSKPRLDFPIAVLINNGSASGAEIVAGALKDLNRAILVGERTFGKGSVQSVIQMPDNSALRLTTAKYFTPSRQVIHERGIEPNIRSVLSPEQERALVIRRNADTLTEAERHEADGIKDPQLDRAVDALKGMMIYRQQMALKAKTP